MRGLFALGVALVYVASAHAAAICSDPVSFDHTWVVHEHSCSSDSTACLADITQATPSSAKAEWSGCPASLDPSLSNQIEFFEAQVKRQQVAAREGPLSLDNGFGLQAGKTLAYTPGGDDLRSGQVETAAKFIAAWGAVGYNKNDYQVKEETGPMGSAERAREQRVMNRETRISLAHATRGLHTYWGQFQNECGRECTNRVATVHVTDQCSREAVERVTRRWLSGDLVYHAKEGLASHKNRKLDIDEVIRGDTTDEMGRRIRMHPCVGMVYMEGATQADPFFADMTNKCKRCVAAKKFYCPRDKECVKKQQKCSGATIKHEESCEFIFNDERTLEYRYKLRLPRSTREDAGEAERRTAEFEDVPLELLQTDSRAGNGDATTEVCFGFTDAYIKEINRVLWENEQNPATPSCIAETNPCARHQADDVRVARTVDARSSEASADPWNLRGRPVEHVEDPTGAVEVGSDDSEPHSPGALMDSADGSLDDLILGRRD